MFPTTARNDTPFKLIHFLLLGFYSLNKKRVNRIAMGTENELQVDLGHLLAFDPYHSFSPFTIFKVYGEYVSGSITDEQRKTVVHNSGPGAGACGGMYTVNMMASAIEAMGMSLPYSISHLCRC
ncbi:hypothetical protein K2173_010257 [Erythroxylum novogranatense]|uniref:Dihydroxy-acid/6-phosphogluconate dehydratase N-terminal domain-containing protein n=1 Tax=Erythroxylum novogranatense TaxID=1862640 RepID=A0AAV8U9F6_9ROSI|nr:hypothetical protein K2173_010257 [Erythroxylum novogranatense]